MTEPVSAVEQIDPHNPRAFHESYEVYRAAETHGRPFATPYALAEARATWQLPQVGEERMLFASWEVDRMVATGVLLLTTQDNLTLVNGAVHVLPESRRCGIGSAVLARLVEEARRRDRRTLVAQVDHAAELGASGVGDPGIDFLRARGFRLTLSEVRRTLHSPVDGALLDALVAEAAPHHAAYTLRSFAGPVPDDLVLSYGRLLGMLVVEAPQGELAHEPEVYDVARIRSDEAVLAGAGRTRYTTVALDRAGEVVAYTDLAVTAHDPGRAYQWGTLVHPGHRGHRLGLAVKALNQQAVQAAHPEPREVHTWNAEVNEPMIGVNARLGFVPTARSAELARDL